MLIWSIEYLCEEVVGEVYSDLVHAFGIDEDEASRQLSDGKQGVPRLMINK